MKRTCVILAAAIFVLSSCTVAVNPEISLSLYRAGVGFEGGSFKTVVSCNTDWYSSCDVDGVVISPAEGVDGDTISVIVPPSDVISTRIVEITVTAEANDVTDYAKFQVTQESRPFIANYTPEVHMGSDGGNAVFLVNSNRHWDVVSSSCNGIPCSLNIDPVFRDANEIEVIVAVPAADSAEENVYLVTLALTDFPQYTAELKIVQEGN